MTRLQVPLFTATEGRRVLRAGLRVSCETPTGLIVPVDAATEVDTASDDARSMGGPDREVGERIRVRARSPGGLFGRKQWCRPVRVWAEESYACGQAADRRDG